MTFLWSKLLWLLLCVPALVGGYVALLNRKTAAVRYTNVALLREALGTSRSMRRHVPPLIYLAAVTALIVAAARPSADLNSLTEQRTVILVLDVSLSMGANDVMPSRLAAAQAAAKGYIARLPGDVRVGLIAFAGSADIVQIPTRNRRYLFQAIDHLELDSNTAIGSGIVAALVALFPRAGLDGPFDVFGMAGAQDGGQRVTRIGSSTTRLGFESAVPGSYSSAAIILLTDGKSIMGMAPAAAAQIAAKRGVRVYTIGIGTIEGTTVNIEGQPVEVSLDEATLKEVAGLTGGQYYYAASADALKDVYEHLSGISIPERKNTEISAVFAAAAIALTLLGAALSLTWFSRLA